MSAYRTTQSNAVPSAKETDAGSRATLDRVFSVIIPTRGRPESLRGCLEAIARLDYPTSAYEVIVVDDGSPASLASVVAAFADRLNIRLVRQRRGGPGAARNAGAALARGVILAFVDDDCAPDPGWLAALQRHFWGSERTLVGGRIENALPDNPFSETSQLITSYAYDYYERNPHAERFFTTNNFAVRAEDFAEAAGFQTFIPAATAEDKEFCDRWRRMGGRLVYAPVAVVRHAHRLTLRGFVRQHFNYGRGILCFRLLRRNGGREAIRPEPLSFYTDLLLYPLRESPGARGWTRVGLMVLAQAATVAGALHASLLDAREMRRRIATARATRIETTDDRQRADRFGHRTDVPAA